MNNEWATHISMRDLELRYRNSSGMTMRKTFSSGVLGTNGFIYELHFLEEEMQALYRMELWGALREPDARQAPGGIFREIIDFEIEVKP